ncbi:molybdopterin-dependent oxidoreductase [Chitinophaga sp. MM2321]|uniref:molybdopterin-dependent oxidoreductase n=1 Tax=Chitinophaga sp. MM2321 TaxID=3137178 RepID=UPI0032D572C8
MYPANFPHTDFRLPAIAPGIHKILFMPLLLLFTMTSWATTNQDTTQRITTTVVVKGLVAHPLVLDINNINQLKVVTGHHLNIVGATGDIKKTFDSYKGISLKSILDSAVITIGHPKEKGKYYIIVKGSDGYTSLYSWNDIYNNPTGEHVFLLFEENGKPIMKDGRFVMICSNDKITGPRHVKWVESIEVAKLP